MRFILPALLLLACAPAALLAQEVVQPLPGTTDADRLAEQMRALASNPRDVNALIAAGELSLGLDDLSGAASLFARAEQVSPRNPRIKAGEGAILVRSERPGEALRYFAQAEAGGLDPRGFAADRGLAYDLIGQQERAQRDYRLALKAGASDEVVRRYALSLGISGKREAALDQLDPLLRKQDRSAWRIRAFILAMGGDQSGAEKIAATMLPAGMAQGLLPFFQRLPSLPAADRAFAVHFGEVNTTSERLADARLAPALPVLAPEQASVALAAAQPATVQPERSRKDRRRRDRDKPGRTEMASAAPSYAAAARALAQVQPLPPSSGAVALAAATTSVAPAAAAPAPAARPSAPPVQIVTLTQAPRPVAAYTATATAAATVQPLPAAASPTSAPVLASVQPAAIAPQPGFTTAATVAATPVTVASTTAPPATTPSASVASAPVPSAPRPVTPVAAAVPVRPRPTPAVIPTPARSRGDADSVLARIVASLSIPAAELGVVEPPRAAPFVAAPAATTPQPVETPDRVLAEAKAKEQRDAEAQKALAAKAVADKRAADRKAAADKKALAAKKLADDKKLAEAKEAAEAKKLARANPARIWVQVAGGANEGDLPKAWSAAKAKAPGLAGKSGWTTPLRATNRVLAGPFKTDAEARSFVNQLKKEGLPAFSFTSDAGQVVTRLPTK